MKRKLSSLKALEKRAYLTYHRDGITDLALGILVLIFGIGMKYDQVMLAPIYGCIGYPVWILLKQWLTEKRLGYVEFGEARQSREKRGWIYLFLLGCIILILGISSFMMVKGGATGWLAGIRGYLMLSVIFAVLISSVGLVLDLMRLHIYSAAIILLGMLGHLLEWKPETGIILPGLLIVVAGGTLLISFLIKYPAGGSDPVASEQGNGDIES